MMLRSCVSRRFLSGGSQRLGFAFDIDGVLLRGSKPVPGAREALQFLNDKKVPYILLTNGGGCLERERGAFISERLGVAIDPLQVVLSHTPYRSLVEKHKKILAVGTDSVRGVAESYGFEDVVHQSDVIRYNREIAPFSGLTVEQLDRNARTIEGLVEKPFDAVVVFNDPHDWGGDVQVISDLLNSENGFLNTRRRGKPSSTPSVPVYFSNDDLLWANGYTVNRFGQGAFRLIVRTLYSALNKGMPLTDTVIGKPSKITYDYAYNMLLAWREVLQNGGTHAGPQTYPKWGQTSVPTGTECVFMVGDNPASDIIGAYNYGWESALVRTGVYKDGDPTPNCKPTLIADNVYDAVTAAIERTS